jgi:hypothetical protein
MKPAFACLRTRSVATVRSEKDSDRRQHEAIEGVAKRALLFQFLSPVAGGSHACAAPAALTALSFTGWDHERRRTDGLRPVAGEYFAPRFPSAAEADRAMSPTLERAKKGRLSPSVPGAFQPIKGRIGYVRGRPRIRTAPGECDLVLTRALPHPIATLSISWSGTMDQRPRCEQWGPMGDPEWKKAPAGATAEPVQSDRGTLGDRGGGEGLHSQGR